MLFNTFWTTEYLSWALKPCDICGALTWIYSCRKFNANSISSGFMDRWPTSKMLANFTSPFVFTPRTGIYSIPIQKPQVSQIAFQSLPVAPLFLGLRTVSKWEKNGMTTTIRPPLTCRNIIHSLKELRIFSQNDAHYAVMRKFEIHNVTWHKFE
jgi:hypothetical protein